jgi:ethanolamine utilization protein EutQ (cupin superfamily)
MQPLVHSRFRYYHYEPDDLDRVTAEPAALLGGGLQRMIAVVNEPAIQIVVEDFWPGTEYRWTTFLDQVDWVIEGRCEVTVEQPPDYAERITVVAEAPCLYLLPRGARVTWKPLGEVVFRHISFDFPNPGFAVVMADSLTRGPEPVGRG